MKNYILYNWFFFFFLSGFIVFDAHQLISKIDAKEISYSLCDSHGVPLDQKLVELMNFKNGVFFEVGAFDGITQSNTKRFEEYHGWTGILVEPSEVLFEKLQLNRPNSICYKCALGSFEEDNTYGWGDFDGLIMSSVNGVRLNRPAQNAVLFRSLQSILDEVGIYEINFFSLDVEGYELHILKGIDFTRTTFDYLLIEIYTHEYEELMSFLFEKGYDCVGNFSNYNHVSNPHWDGTHNDYLFRRRS